MLKVENQRLSYSELLQGGFKSLGHFADEAFQATSDREFFKILCENIVPLITKSEAFEPLYLEWISEKGKFKKNMRLPRKRRSKK